MSLSIVPTLQLPAERKAQLEEIHRLLEAETQEKYQFTIQKFGDSGTNPSVIGDFKTLSGFVLVFDMHDDYALLNGTYHSRQDLREMIRSLKIKNPDLWNDVAIFVEEGEIAIEKEEIAKVSGASVYFKTVIGKFKYI